MSSPLRPLVADSHEQTGGGIALMWSLAKHFKCKTFKYVLVFYSNLSNDLVFFQCYSIPYFSVTF